VPHPLAPRYYGARASAGLIVTEATHADPHGYGYANTPGIETPGQIAAWRTVTDLVHARGGRIFLQIWHVGRLAHPDGFPDGALPVAPSAIAAEGTFRSPAGMRPFVTPRALERDELPGIVAGFVTGARDAIDAGFDGVEIHGANGYLLDQFLRDGTNRRTDDYGGSVANRTRLLLEVVEAVSAAIGADRVGVRLSPFNSTNSMHDGDPETLFAHVAGALAGRGLAYLHVMAMTQRGTERVRVEGTDLLQRMRHAFGGTFVVNGGFTVESAESAIRGGSADLVAFGQPFIANPDLVARIAEGVPLAVPDRATYYTGGEAGYVDYPDRFGHVPTPDLEGAPGADVGELLVGAGRVAA
jgi:N-ethylmaleimide reductase